MEKTGLEYIRSDTKKRLNLIGGTALALTTMPATILVGIEAAIEHKTTNPLYIRERIGRYGKSFKNYKFQSLRVRDAEKKLIGGYAHPDASKIGTLVRKSCLDELPQLANVIKGDISLVGIRPVPQNFLEYYEKIASTELFDEWHAWYLENPGLFGEGQLESNLQQLHSTDVIRRRMAVDIQASENASLKNDLTVIAQTPTSLLRRMYDSRI